MKLEVLKELFMYLKHSRKYWLVPIIIILLLLSLAVIFSGNSAVAPFIYALF